MAGGRDREPSRCLWRICAFWGPRSDGPSGAVCCSGGTFLSNLRSFRIIFQVKTNWNKKLRLQQPSSPLLTESFGENVLRESPDFKQLADLSWSMMILFNFSDFHTFMSLLYKFVQLILLTGVSYQQEKGKRVIYSLSLTLLSRESQQSKKYSAVCGKKI